MNRDPYLPPPEVCDWLRSLEWSDVIPASVTHFPNGGPFGVSKNKCYNFVYADTSLGTNEIVSIKLPAEALQVLEQDADARRKMGAANHAHA